MGALTSSPFSPSSRGIGLGLERQILMLRVSVGAIMRRSIATSSKIIFSGIQPSSIPHIGNYFGALKNWVNEQKEGRGDLALL